MVGSLSSSPAKAVLMASLTVILTGGLVSSTASPSLLAPCLNLIDWTKNLGVLFKFLLRFY